MIIECKECVFGKRCPCGWSHCNAACLTIQKPKQDINCSTCPYRIISHNNYVQCELLHTGLDYVSVNWFYWNNSKPNECPL